MWANFVCLYRSLDERSRESRKTIEGIVSSGFVDILKVKVGKCPHNRDRRLLAGKCIKKPHERKISEEGGAECVLF